VLSAPNDLIPFTGQPVVELMRRMPASGLASLPNLFKSVRTRLLGVKLGLQRALDVLAEFSSLIVNISFNGHQAFFSGS